MPPRGAAVTPLRLICLDVDGTLVGSRGTVDPAVWSAADRLRASGVDLAVCTGRPGFGLARGYAERLDAAGWHIFQNGASVVHVGTGESRSAGLPASVVPALVAQARRTGRTLELYADASYVVEPGHADPAERARRHADLLGVPYETRPLDALGAPVVRAQWMVGADEVEAVLADPVAGTRLVASTSPVMMDTAFVSVLAPGVDKAAAVRALASASGVALSAVMFVGDGANDAGAMDAVGRGGGHPVAMGNAEPEALAVARHVVGDVEAGGLVEALALAATFARR